MAAVAVVGAGIIGCLAAREAVARNPGGPVVLLDQDGVGGGATRRSAGLHLPRGGSERTRRMSGYSHAYYARLAREHPGLPIFPVGATVVADAGAIGGYLPGAATAVDAAGVSTGEPAPGELAPGEPPGPLAAAGVSVPAGMGAWRVAGAHYADVYRLAQALALELRPRADVLEGVAVTGLEPGAGAVTVRLGTGTELAAAGVILAPGPWLAAPPWRDLVAPLALRVKRIVALHVDRRPAPGDEVIAFDSDDAFLLPLADRGHWLFSYSCREWDVDPDTPAAGLSAGHVSAARECLRRYSPALAGACAGGRVFCDAYGPGGEPVVRALDLPGRIVFAGAASGSGYRLAPAIAAEAADLLNLRSQGVTGDRQHV